MRAKWIILLSILLALLVTGCDEKKKEDAKPEDFFSEYVQAWNDQKFSEMYGMLSEDVKSEISKEDFVERYEKIYGDLKVSDLKVAFEKPKEETETNGKEETEDKQETVTIPFTVSMNTMGGPIEFENEAELVKVVTGEEEDDQEVNWYVKWNTGFIFAGMLPEDRVSMKIVEPERGEILDRNGNGLAINGEIYEVGLVPERLGEDAGEKKEKLAELLGISVESIDNALNASWVQPNYFVPIKRIAGSNVDLVEEIRHIQGVQINTVTGRTYPLGDAAAHLIGYIGEVTAEELEKNEGYTAGDVIGKRGLEQLFEKRLKGEEGLSIFIEKPNGTTITLTEKPVKNGETIQLTIDSEMQKNVLSQFNGKAGTAVALHPKTGETLAMVSSPSFDPNEYMFMAANERQKLVEDPLEPLLNRFVYPHTPGSVMKLFTAAAALDSGTITPEQQRDIKTRQWQKDNSWGGYFVTRVADPGRPVNLKDAIVLSDNIYFAQTALEMGASDFVDRMKLFGFGEEIPFAYPLESSQISNEGTLNNEILLADSAYGQGQVQTNIVQLASGYTAFLNGGNMIQPVLLKDEALSQVWKEKVITEESIKILRDYMRAVVTDPSGTAHVANTSSVPLAGKTGTAEVAKQEQGQQAVENGWFVGYNTDAEDLLVVMTMEGIQGQGSIVVQAVRSIFESR